MLKVKKKKKKKKIPRKFKISNFAYALIIAYALNSPMTLNI